VILIFTSGAIDFNRGSYFATVVARRSPTTDDFLGHHLLLALDQLGRIGPIPV